MFSVWCRYLICFLMIFLHLKPVAGPDGRARTATSAWCIPAASTATATRRGTASARPTGEECSAIKVTSLIH